MGSGDGCALVSHMQIYSFRNCLLNTVERRVMRHGQLLDLTPRTFDVLQLLVERSGEIVTKDEMLGKVWDGSFVEEANLPVHRAATWRLSICLCPANGGGPGAGGRYLLQRRARA